MSTHNICFHREIKKILSGYPHLICSYGKGPHNLCGNTLRICLPLNPTLIYPAFANSVDPDQLASEEAN